MTTERRLEPWGHKLRTAWGHQHPKDRLGPPGAGRGGRTRPQGLPRERGPGTPGFGTSRLHVRKREFFAEASVPQGSASHFTPSGVRRWLFPALKVTCK